MKGIVNDFAVHSEVNALVCRHTESISNIGYDTMWTAT